jgi:hypothetical protein
LAGYDSKNKSIIILIKYKILYLYSPLVGNVTVPRTSYQMGAENTNHREKSSMMNSRFLDEVI